MRKLSLPLILLLLFTFQTISAQPDRGVGNRSTGKRLALVIGNSDYQNTSSLPNPKNDAADMKAALELLGFEVVYGVNQNRRQMMELMRQFGNKLAQTKAVGLFYYAGHGLAAGGENYLVPIDADIPAEDEIAEATVSLSFLMNKIAVAENDLNIVILDACRNNPFVRKWQTVRDISSNGGLATIRQAPYGTLIAYATQPGNVASDGTGRNGLYTAELLQQMKKPNMQIEDVFKNVRSQVRQKSRGQQVPWESSSIEGNFYFAVGGNSQSTLAPKVSPIVSNTPLNTQENRNEITNSLGMKFIKVDGKGFYIGKFEVTQAEWKTIMKSLPTKCDFLSERYLGDRKPIMCVSWDDVQDFIRKLNTKNIGLYRLPTEAEWRNMATANANTTYFGGNNEKLATDYGWYKENSKGQPQSVGLKKPNEFGFFDVSGNVGEWCQDGGISFRVWCGDTWNSSSPYKDLKCSASPPSMRNSVIGFRLVLE